MESAQPFPFLPQHHQLNEHDLSKLHEMVKDRKAWHAAGHGVTKSQTPLRDWTELNWAWKMLKGDTIRLQPWFIIRRVSWLYIVAYTSGCHKDYKGDWLHRGLLHSFWRQEILVWNLVFISPGGQFSRRYVIIMATRHIVQSSLRVQDRVSFFFRMESARPVPFLPQSHPKEFRA